MYVYIYISLTAARWCGQRDRRHGHAFGSWQNLFLPCNCICDYTIMCVFVQSRFLTMARLDHWLDQVLYVVLFYLRDKIIVLHQNDWTWRTKASNTHRLPLFYFSLSKVLPHFNIELYGTGTHGMIRFANLTCLKYYIVLNSVTCPLLLVSFLFLVVRPGAPSSVLCS